MDMRQKFYNIFQKTTVFCLLLVWSVSVSVKADTFIVSTADATGKGSFQEALLRANAHKGADKIIFNLPMSTSQWAILNLNNSEYRIIDDLIIDGSASAQGLTPFVVLNTEGGVSAFKNITFKGIGFVKNNKLTIQSNAKLLFENCVFLDKKANASLYKASSMVIPVEDDNYFKNCVLEVGETADPSFKCGTVGNWVKNFNYIANVSNLELSSFIQKTAKFFVKNKNIVQKGLLTLRRDTVISDNTQRILYKIAGKQDTIPVVKGSGGTENCDNNSNVLSIVVSEHTVIMAQPNDITECIGGNQQLTVAVVGGNGNLSYQWQESTDGITFTDVAGGTSNTYTPPSTTAGTKYYRIVINSDVTGCGSITSSAATVGILADPTVTIKATKNFICIGETAGLSSTVTGGSGTPVYQWESSTDGSTWANVAGGNAVTLSIPNVVVTTLFRLKITQGNGCESYSNVETITANGCQGVIGDFAWLDCNKNGSQDAGEGGIAGITVTLTGTTLDGESVSVNTTTSGTGQYQFKDIKPGRYKLSFSKPTGGGLGFTKKGEGNRDIDNDADGGGISDVFNFGSNEVLTNIDAGYTDVTAPIVEAAQDKEVSCDGLGNEKDLQDWLLAHGGAKATDNLSTNLTWTHNYNGLTKSCGNSGETRVTFTVTDECGNSSTTSAIFRVKDNDKPVFNDKPSDLSLKCGDPVPAVRAPSVFDACDPAPKVVFTEKREDLCGSAYKVTRTWVATDACGNSESFSQTVSFEDNEPPVFTNIPNAIKLSCSDPIPNGAGIIAKDNCDGNPQVTMSDLIERGTCGGNYKINRIWTAADVCGNIAKATQVIEIGDFTAPTIMGVPADKLVTCGNLVGQPDRSVKATDLCSETVRLTVNDRVQSGACIDQYVVTRTWTATDNCGNVSTKAQKITVKDDVKPELIGVPTDLVVNLYQGQKVPLAANVIGTDNCDSRVDVKYTETKINNLCGYSLKRTWAASDNCSNRLEKSQIITVNIAENLTKIASVTPENCNDNNGRIEMSPTNYTYKWSDGQTGYLRTNMAAGTYKVTATSSANCAKEIEVVVKRECDCTRPIVSVDKQDMTCQTLDGGTAVINIANGLPSDFKFIWSPNISTTNIGRNLAAGSYSVRVERANKPSCFTEITFSIRGVNILEVQAPLVENAGCLSPSGKITFTIPVGDVLKFKWSSGDTLPVRTNLSAGIYNVTITRPNSNTCPLEKKIEVRSDNPMSSTYVVNRLPSCGLPNGSVTINTVGGSGNYKYSWGEGNSRFVLPAGPTTVTVTDLVTGCINVVSFVLTTQTTEAKILMDSVFYVTCPGLADGRINYSLVLSETFAKPAKVVIMDMQNNMFSNGALAAGSYIAMVKDSVGCMAGETKFTVLNPAVITPVVTVLPQTCDSLGSIDLKVTGGRSPYKYSWADLIGQTNQPAYRENLKAGFYTLTISDAVGCQRLVRNVQVKDSCACRPPVVDSIAIVAANCGQSNGSALIILRGGNESNYNFTWTPNEGTANTIGNGRTGLRSAIYDVTISAKNSVTCAATVKVAIGSLEGPQNVKVVTSPATCDAANGSAILSVNSAEAHTYYWVFDGKTAETRNDLKEGYYQVYVSKASNIDCKTLVIVKIESQNNLAALAIVKQLPTCGQSNGSVAIRVLGGSGSYTYSGLTDSVKNNLKAGTYTVTVADTKTGCKTVVTFALSDDIQANADIIMPNTTVYLNCNGNRNGHIDYKIAYAAGFAHPAQIYITDGKGRMWGNDSLPMGSYCLIVKDAQGCMAASKCFEVFEPKPLLATLTKGNKTCDIGGSIRVSNIKGGTAPYLVAWSDQPALSSTFERFNLGGGTYSVTIYDSKGCSFVFDNISVKNECTTQNTCTDFKATFAAENKSCTEGGKIVLSMTGGIQPYTFDWSDLAGTSNPQNRFGLEAGTYSVVVKDSTGCSFTLNNIVINNTCNPNPTTCTPPIISDVLVSNATCNQSNGQITVVVSKPTNVIYKWYPNIGNTNVINNVAAGTYKVKICTGGDTTCFIEKTIIVKNIDGIAVTQPSILPASCGAANGKAEFAAVGRPLNFAWSDGKYGISRSDLVKGYYTVTITDPIGEWCKQIVELEVPSTNTLVAIGIVNTKSACGQSNGQATIQVVGGSGSYTYSWGTSATRTDLKAGTYNVVVTDNTTGCQANVTVVMTDNVSAFAMVNVTQPVIYLTCGGANDGTVNYSINYPSGFATPATVVIQDNFGRVAKNDSLAAGRYTILVYDKNQCLAGLGNFEIKEPPVLYINSNVQAETCLSKGGIALNISGGSGSYKVRWSDLTSDNQPFVRTGLSAGEYFVAVTDSRGCTKHIQLVVRNEAFNCNGECDLVAKAIASAKTCTEGGKIQLLISNGSGRYGFLWSDLGENPAQPQDRWQLAAGTYSVIVIDSATNCKVKVTNIIVENKAINCGVRCDIVAIAEFLDKTCTEGGIIKIVSITGLAPHKFDWLDLPTDNNPQNRFNLLAGQYTVIITDSLGCKDTLSVTIQDKCRSTCVPPVIGNATVVDATCFEKTGSIDMTMAGASTFKYQWTPNVSSTNQATNLLAGLYKVKISRIEDSLCFIEKEFLVNNKNESLTLGVPTITNATCGASNGSVTINGRDSWRYVWNDGKTGKTRTGLPQGTYYVTVTDPSVLSCPVSQEIVIRATGGLQTTATIVKKPTCGGSNGEVTINTMGGSGSYNYSWGNTATRTNLKAGSYNVTVFDNQTGCNGVVAINLIEEVTAIATVKLDIPTLTLNCRGDKNGKITYNVMYAVGFATPATIKIVDAVGNTVENGKLGAGKYKVVVMDANGCMAGMASFEIFEPEMFAAKASIKAAECNTLGTITLTVTGGTPRYTYDWADLDGTDDPKDRANIAAGLYSVTVKDAKGCFVSVQNIVVANMCVTAKPKRDTVYKTFVINRLDSVCLPTDLALIGRTLSHSLCSGSLTSSTNMGTTTVGTSNCINYKANNNIGREELCVKSCTSDGVCDTTIIIINIISDPGSCITGYLGASTVGVTRCDTTATICTNIPYRLMDNYTVTDNGVPTQFYIDGCKKDTVYTYSYATLTKFYPNGPWDLDEWFVDNQVFKGRIFSLQGLVDSMNRWDPFGNWTLDLTKNAIIGGDSRRTYKSMSWKRNGRIVATFQANRQFVPSVVSLRLAVGQHKIVFTDKTKNCKDSANINIVCNIEPLKKGSYTIDTVLFVGQRSIYCLNNSNWSSQTTIRNVCVSNYKGYASYSIDDVTDCIKVIGVGLGRDTLCLRRCYNDGTCDTVKMYLSVKPLQSASDTACIDVYSGLNYFNIPCGTKARMCTNLTGTDTLNYYITINGMQFRNGYSACASDTIYAYTYFSLTLSNPTGPWYLDGWLVNGNKYTGVISSMRALVDSMNVWDRGGNWRLETSNYAIKGGQSGKNYGTMTWYRNGTTTRIASFGYNRQFVIKQIGLMLDPGNHQIIFKNTLRGCSDTANIVVECRQLRTRPTMTIKDTVVYLNENIKYCLPTNGLLASSTSLTPVCNVKGYVNYVTDDANDCVIISGANEGRDTICLQRCDFDGECDTIKIAVLVVKKQTVATETVYRTIKMGLDSSYCVDTKELKGIRFTLKNTCETNSTNNVNFVIQGTCVKYLADNMGIDTACLVVCDELGGCDTTRLIVYVINERQTLPAPIAVNDRATTPKATKVNITPIVNDTVFNLPAEIILLTKPLAGSVFFDPVTKVVTYTPESAECVGVDTFTYALVTIGGRDTAYIKVEVMCDEVVVFSGFSPNNDGVNDNFTILGLEKYPNNKLYVFNRWGNQVFAADKYQGEWNGSLDGVMVPDGTYFYILDLGNGKKLSGYVQIHR